MSSHWTALKIGIALAILNFDGTTPVTSDELMMSVKGSAMKVEICFIILGCIPS